MIVGVALAGGLGAMTRLAVDRCVSARWNGWGVTVVNISACFLLGLAASSLHGWHYALVATGFLGGYSTFSTAMVEVIAAGSATQGVRAQTPPFLRLIFMLAASWLAVWAGLAVAARH